MAKVVALIRGVGGPTALKMAELREVATGIGLGGVATLQVAGNVVFDEPDEPLTGAAQRLRAAMLDRFGHDLAVITRTHAQLVDALERDPYKGTHEGRFLATFFLDRAPDPAKVAALDPQRSPGDVFTVDGAEVFVRFESGQGTSKLQLPWFEKGLGVIGTARNANTVAKLADMTA